jgi:hypothetical protein
MTFPLSFKISCTTDLSHLNLFSRENKQWTPTTHPHLYKYGCNKIRQCICMFRSTKFSNKFMEVLVVPRTSISVPWTDFCISQGTIGRETEITSYLVPEQRARCGSRSLGTLVPNGEGAGPGGGNLELPCQTKQSMSRTQMGSGTSGTEIRRGRGAGGAKPRLGYCIGRAEARCWRGGARPVVRRTGGVEAWGRRRGGRPEARAGGVEAARTRWVGGVGALVAWSGWMEACMGEGLWTCGEWISLDLQGFYLEKIACMPRKIIAHVLYAIEN